jgi:hypothetical protein
MSELDFATGLLARGIEIVLRGNRLWVWPPKAHGYLTDAEREYIHEHRNELKELARSHALPETTVVWQPPTEVTHATTTQEPTTAPCSYCGGACVGPTSPHYRALHWTDPTEVAKRNAAATDVMMRQIGKSI